MTVRKLSVWPVVQPEQCKLGTFSTAAASATAGRSALIGTRDVRIRGPYFHLLSFHDLRLRLQCQLRVGRPLRPRTKTRTALHWLIFLQREAFVSRQRDGPTTWTASFPHPYIDIGKYENTRIWNGDNEPCRHRLPRSAAWYAVIESPPTMHFSCDGLIRTTCMLRRHGHHSRLRDQLHSLEGVCSVNRISTRYCVDAHKGS